MAGLLPAIHVFGILGVEDVDARHIGERSDAVLRTASHQNEREMLERFIRDEPVLCNKTLAHITTQDFEAYRDKRLKTIKPSTLRRELNPLRTIFRIAKKNRHIPLTSPFDSLEVPKEDNERERLLSRDERDRLFKATLKCRGERQGYLWRALVVAALSTAMRRGELLKAKWGDVDFEKLTWNIPASNNKSSRSRLLPISKLLRDNLQSYYNLLPEQDRKTEFPVFQSRKKDKQGNAVILPLSPSAHEQAFRRLCKRAKPNLHLPTAVAFSNRRHGRVPFQHIGVATRGLARAQ